MNPVKERLDRRVSHLGKLFFSIFCSVFLAQESAKSATYIAPPAFVNTDGASGAGDIYHTIHIQTVYSGFMFTNTGPMLIQEIRYRPSGTVGFAFTSSIPNIQLNLSTSSANPEALSATFANNRGANDTLVFQGPITLSSRFIGPSGGPKAFDIIFPLQTAFLYDPSAGNLVVELRNFSNNNEAAYPDAVGVPGDGAGRVFSTDPNALSGAPDTGSDIAQFVYTVPSSSSVITAQPQSQSVPVGSTVTFSVSAYGSQPLSYQWTFNDTNVANATNASLVLNNVGFADRGTYRVLVTNLFGQTPSSNAVLDVFVVPPAITSQPQNQRAPAGSSAMFSVTASGTQP